MKGSNKISCLILLIIFPFVFIHPQTEQYKFRHLTTEDGLPSNYVWRVLKDSKGFIWIGTNAGLCRYDGYKIKVYQYDPVDSNSLIHSNIRIMIEDKAGNLWVGTMFGLNKFDPVTEKFTRYIPHPDKPGSISSIGISCLLVDKDGVLWVGTTFDGGFNKYDPITDEFKNYKLFPVDTSVNNVRSMYEDQSGIFWIGTDKGLYQFNRETGEFTCIEPQTPLPDNFMPEYRAMCEDEQGNMWFVTPKAILKYARETTEPAVLRPIMGGEKQFFKSVARDILVEPMNEGHILWIASNGLGKVNWPANEGIRIMPDPADPKSIVGTSVNHLFKDGTGMLWISTAYGLSILDKESTRFEEHCDFAEKYSCGAKAFLEDRNGDFWIGTGDEGVIHFDSAMNEIHWYNNLKLNEEGYKISGTVKDIIEDSEGNIWAGDNKTGVYYLDREKDEFVYCKLTDRPLKSSFVFDLCKDSDGSIWVGTQYGVFRRKKDNKLFTNFSFVPISDPPMTRPARSIIEDRSGNLWICVNAFGIFCQPPELKGTDTFIHYAHNPGDTNSLSNNNVMSVYEDRNSTLWFGTRYGLNRFDRNTGNFKNILFDMNEASNFIGGITEDNKGNLWLTTQIGLLRFKTPTADDIANNNFMVKQFLPFNKIYLQRISRGKDGKMFIGAPETSGLGYISFYPDSIEDNQHIPQLVITEFQVRNKPVTPDSNISVKKHIKLNYKENFFTFEFSALDYTNPDKNRYAYYLEGLENDWIYSGNRRLANYTGVPPGNYIFHAKGSNNDGYWNQEGTSLSITILPPPWKTWWAYSLYVLFIGSVLYFIIRFYLKRQRLLNELELEHVQTEKLEELDRLKSRFFANISHEFRTPLTLILGPLQSLISLSKDDKTKQDLNIMQRNAHRLQNLINQLLNLSKLESGKMKLQAREENIVALINGYIQSFESLAKQKKIALNFKSTEENIPVFVDKDKIEKILFNLLSNAFKFTGVGGLIEVAVSCNGSAATDFVEIKISDTGPSIPPDKLTHIFDRFYQADDSYTKDQEGSGIGLALTKELVELHHGKITVDSQLGEGTLFTVFLPLGKEYLKPEEIVNSAEPDEMLEPVEHIIQFTESETKEILIDDEKEDTRPLLLIVEDNDDLRAYIRSYLADDYRISEAIDGEMGMKKAIEKIPDLIISDVMMPKMDGYELCEKLKTDERTSHIPVVLLTARASMESRIEGLETGADDFITKPFDPVELQTRVKNLIVQRRRLQDRFMKKIRKMGLEHFFEKETEDITPMDQKFMQRIILIIQKYLSDPDFDVEMLSSAMALSRMQVHRKLMGLSGYTPGNFIRHLRLNKAAELIKNKTGTVSEITFDVGFNNLSYFSKCFKKQFGVLPSEYNTTKTKS
jgi:signal transduction histidine kinase/ligand-binding sensor domain-containing protein/CheY-like chemotaxis protein